MTSTISRSTLSSLAAQINASHRQAIATAQTALDHARHCGELLTQAKSKVQHGKWLHWINKNCDLSSRQVQRYMRAYEDRDKISKSDAMSYLGIDETMSRLSPISLGPLRGQVAEMVVKIESALLANLTFEEYTDILSEGLKVQGKLAGWQMRLETNMQLWLDSMTPGDQEFGVWFLEATDIERDRYIRELRSKAEAKFGAEVLA